MLILIWLVVCLLGIAIMLLPAAIWGRTLLRRYSGSRLVSCPENHQAAVVDVDAQHAAATGLHGRPDLRLSCCTRWPERADCGQPCLDQALATEPYSPPPLRTRTKPIYHLPVLLAAFAAWCLGAIWNAPWLFRTHWTQALGLTGAQMKQLAWWISPHLLTAAVCLLFAYGVAWLLAVRHRKGIVQGVLMALLLAGALAAASWAGLARLPHDLLRVEATYVALATLLVGTIVGGLYDKLVLPSI
jgi:hypothetical protein